MAGYVFLVKKSTVGSRRVSPLTLTFQTHFMDGADLGGAQSRAMVDGSGDDTFRPGRAVSDHQSIQLRGCLARRATFLSGDRHLDRGELAVLLTGARSHNVRRRRNPDLQFRLHRVAPVGVPGRLTDR